MTFYSVISGILFLGCLQAFLGSIGTVRAWPSAVLMITALNESVLTSELLERDGPSKVTYTLKMKLLDFVAFGGLTWALLSLSPTSNAFNVNVASTLWGASVPAVFWGCLTFYWLVTLGWNYAAGQVDCHKWRVWLIVAMHFMWLPPFIASYASRLSGSFESAPRSPGPILFVCVLTYLVSKLWAEREPMI